MTKAITFVWWMLASTIQFSHNTPHHPGQTTATQKQLALTWCGHQDQPINKWIVVPDTQQCTNDLPRRFLSLYMFQRTSVTNLVVGGVFPLRFKPVA